MMCLSSKLLSIYLTLVLCFVALSSQFSLAREGTNHGGGGDERGSTQVEILKALHDLYGPSYEIAVSAPNLQGFSGRDKAKDEEVDKVFGVMFSSYASLPLRFALADSKNAEETDIIVKPQQQCMLNGKIHLGTNQPLADRSDGKKRWQVCYNLSLLEKYSPAGLKAVIISMHYHELTEILGFSHQIARKVQEDLRIRIPYNPLLNEIRLARSILALERPPLEGQSVAAPPLNTLELKKHSYVKIAALLNEGSVAIGDNNRPFSLDKLTPKEQRILLSYLDLQYEDSVLENEAGEKPILEAFCDKGRSGDYSLKDDAVVKELISLLSASASGNAMLLLAKERGPKEYGNSLAFGNCRLKDFEETIESYQNSLLILNLLEKEIAQTIALQESKIDSIIATETEN